MRTGKINSTTQQAEQAIDRGFKPLSSYGPGQNTSLLSAQELGKSLGHQRTFFQERATERTFTKPLEILPKFATPNKSNVTGLGSTQLQYSASKAYTSAMKALQDRTRQLERENDHLRMKDKEVEKTLEEEQNKMRNKMMEEMSRCAEIEKKLQRELRTVAEENKQLRQEFADKEFVQRQVQQLEKEKERHLEQNSVDRELWRKEKAQLLSQISEGNERMQELARQKEMMMSEIEETKSRLSEIEGLFDKSKRDAGSETKRLKAESEAYRGKVKSMKKQFDTDILALRSVCFRVNVDRNCKRLKRRSISISSE